MTERERPNRSPTARMAGPWYRIVASVVVIAIGLVLGLIALFLRAPTAWLFGALAPPTLVVGILWLYRGSRVAVAGHHGDAHSSGESSDGAARSATRATLPAWIAIVSSLLLLLECASITFTNDEDGGLIRIDLLLVLPLGALAGVALVWSRIALAAGQRGAVTAMFLSALAGGVLAICWFGGHEIFVVTAHLADAIGFRPKDCVGDSTPRFDWGRYCPV